MTILSTVYASAPAAEVLIPCLEISLPAFVQPIRNCAGFEDHTVTLEDDTVAWRSYPGRRAQPKGG